MLFIGDVHGKTEEYLEKIQMFKESICVGDFGFKREWDWLENHVNCLRHKVVMGNHDWYPYLHEHPCSLKDWSYNGDRDIFTVRGASSIDRIHRVEGRDWFANEEMSYIEAGTVYEKYLELKPSIVVSHDCPQKLMEQLFGYKEKSLTRQLLQTMFEEHQPKWWIFGHHHKSIKVEMNGTNFVCLAELETFIL